MSYHLKGSLYRDNVGSKKIKVISAYDGVFDEIDILPPKIIVGVSITIAREDTYHPGVWTVPVIVDTGCNSVLQIDERHLEKWTGIKKAYLEIDGRTRSYHGRNYNYCFADIWLHGSMYKSPSSSEYNKFPKLLKNTRTIMVMEPSTDEPEPRLPLLGLRALLANNLQLKIDTYSGTFTLSTFRTLFSFEI